MRIFCYTALLLLLPFLATTQSYIFSDPAFDNSSTCNAGNTGWNLDTLEVAYDWAGDFLSVRVSAHNGIPVSDIEGDGDPNTYTCPEGDSGVDSPNMGMGEGHDFVIDIGADGSYEYVAGKIVDFGDNDIDSFLVSNYISPGSTPNTISGLNTHGAKVTGVSVSMVNKPSGTNPNPDLIYRINNFSNLFGANPMIFDCFANVGSVMDGVAGEDVAVGTNLDFTGAKIGDFIWDDANKNGIQDGSEVGINNVAVDLYGTGPDLIWGNSDDVSKSVLTANDGGSPSRDGWYQFNNLPPGNYYAEISIPSGYIATTKNNGSSDTDSNLHTSGKTDTFNVSVISRTYNIDGGVYLSSLPVELTQFDVQEKACKNILSWLTLSEENNQGFQIERRVADSPFEAIGFVKGRGTSAIPNYYEFVDDRPMASAYYRLQQIDFDGNAEYSEVVYNELACLKKDALPTAELFPNPVSTEEVAVMFESATMSLADLRVYNSLGVLQLVKQKKVESGWNEMKFLLADLPAGIYYVKLQVGNVPLMAKPLLKVRR